MKELPVAIPMMCCAADLLGTHPKRQIVLVGHRESPKFQALIDACHALYDPDRVVSDLLCAKNVKE
jgi:hypothetical protein